MTGKLIKYDLEARDRLKPGVDSLANAAVFVLRDNHHGLSAVDLMALIEGKEFLIMRESDLYAVIRRTKTNAESGRDSLHFSVPLNRISAEAVVVPDQRETGEDPHDIFSEDLYIRDIINKYDFPGDDIDMRDWRNELAAATQRLSTPAARAGNRYQVGIRRTGIN